MLAAAYDLAKINGPVRIWSATFQMDDLQRAWAAGFLEGEGSFIVKKGQMSVVVRAESTDYDAVERLKRIFGGYIYVVSKRKSHWKDARIWQISHPEEVEKCVYAVLPFLLERRTEQANKILLRIREIKDKKKTFEIRDKEIVRLRETGLTHKEIAKRFNVSRTLITHILNK